MGNHKYYEGERNQYTISTNQPIHVHIHIHSLIFVHRSSQLY